VEAKKMRSESEIKNAVDSLIRKEAFARWAPETLGIWLRDDCNCVYCGLDMLSDWGIAYHFSTLDHLLPSSIYPALADSSSNKVLCCRACNNLKRTFDANQDGSIDELQTALSVEQRAALLEKAKVHVHSLRELNVKRFAEEARNLRTETPSRAAA
jgi:hypothetical protein